MSERLQIDPCACGTPDDMAVRILADGFGNRRVGIIHCLDCGSYECGPIWGWDDLLNPQLVRRWNHLQQRRITTP